MALFKLSTMLTVDSGQDEVLEGASLVTEGAGTSLSVNGAYSTYIIHTCNTVTI